MKTNTAEDFNDYPLTISQQALQEIDNRVLKLLRDSDCIKISMRQVLEDVRQFYPGEINNNEQTQITDNLIAKYPELSKKVTIRARGARGKNNIKTSSAHNPDLLALLIAFPEDIQVQSFTFTFKGNPYKVTQGASMAAVHQRAKYRQAQ